MASPDPLFSVRNNFYLGAYQTAISDASSLTGLSEDQKLERDTFVYRSYVELGSYEMVLSEIPADAPPPLAAVRQLASYHKAGPSPSSPVPDALEAGLSDGALSSDPTYLYVTALLLALSVQVMLSLHRPDAAERQLRAMAAIDDDATLTQLAGAWVALAAGGPRVREAASIYQELGDRFAWTPRLHAGLASAQACMGRWEDAEAELLQAVEKNPKDPDSLANLAVVSLHLGKPAGRYLGVLKDVAPSHALLERRAAAEEAFDRAASGITA
ncbi:Coatomer subunit epsilon-2 [Auxenochlorella protothecoides]|uniref:Coatomer subunit epsilon n=1 Tax=Auxenochlorella protothecoides TaxID=3075 RepID=A0A087SIF2_AUXPR|nr:Coatomer subunit epsilon-2 [Auxenochlorella protothecoides]KFM25506.1 Coatomer subunit epsilon-2 [Auxenochlorella protothecoides]